MTSARNGTVVDRVLPLETPELLRLFQAATDHLHLPLAAAVGADHTVCYANPAFCQLTGKRLRDMLGHPFFEAIPAEHRRASVSMLNRVRSSGKPEVLEELPYQNAKGTMQCWSYEAWAPPRQKQLPEIVIVQIADVMDTFHASDHYRKANDELRAANEALVAANVRANELAASKSAIDPRTKLPWPDYLREWAVDQLSSGHEIAVIFIDLDRFGEFNKIYGHIVGDEVLVAVAQALRELTDPATEALCRYGGDEFCIATLRSPESMTGLIEEITHRISSIEIPSIPNTHISCVVGKCGGRRRRERENVHYLAMVNDLINKASLDCTAHKSEYLVRALVRERFDEAPQTKPHLATCSDLALRDINQELVMACIRQLERAEEVETTHQMLLQSKKLESLGRLVSGVAHDFNNILTIILGLSELAGSAIRREDVCRHLKLIQQAANRGAGVTAHLLAFARNHAIQTNIVDMNQLISEIETLLRPIIGEHIELILDLDPRPATAKIEPSQFEQMMVNLVTNARDAMPSGGRISITTTVQLPQQDTPIQEHDGLPPRDYVLVSVKDTGSGIAAEMQGHLFEAFCTTKENGKGTGLGLASGYGFVRHSGGHIQVDSTPGSGSTFRVYFPYVEDPVMLASREAVQASSQGSEAICIVEDDATIREIGASILKRHGYHVIHAANGHDALKAIAKCPQVIDLLITDVVMPRMGGGELSRRVRESYPDMKVLFTSGYAADAMTQRDLLEERCEFLPKPYTPAGLAQKVRWTLDRSWEYAIAS